MIVARTHVDHVGCTSMVFHSSAKVVENVLERTKLNGAAKAEEQHLYADVEVLAQKARDRDEQQVWR